MTFYPKQLPQDITPWARRLLCALVSAGLLLLAACGGNKAGDKTVRWALALPTSWDPVTSRTGADVYSISLAYASLTRLDKAGNVEPSLAQSWHYSGGGRAISFELRKGLKFTDGTPLDAAAVQAFFERGKAQANSFVKDQLTDVASVTIEGPLQVTLHLSKPDYQIPYLVAGRTGAIPSPGAARKDLARLSQWPVGAGPFKIVEFVPESHAYFVKNPDYWDAANIHIDRLELTVAPDPATLVAGLSSGSIDVATLVASRIAEAKAADLAVTIAPSLSARDVSINLNKPPFTNPKVVEAFRYAFDRDEIVKVLTKGVAKPVHQPFPPGYFAFNPEIETLWHYDPARAKALLAQAGYGPGQLSIVITANALADGEPTAELVQAQLARIGVKSTIRIVPPGSSTWQSQVYIAKNAQFATDGTIGRESPTQSLLADFGPAGIMNLSGPHASAEFLTVLELVNATPVDDPHYQRRLWDAVKVAVQQSPTNYLFSTPQVIVSRPRIRNLNITPSQLRWEGVRVD